MAVILTNEQEIQAPAPGARRYGLFTAASTGTLDPRWAATGVQFVAEDCGMGVLPYDPTCAPPHDTKVFTPDGTVVDAAPYWLYATYQCGTVGTTPADVQRRVQKRYQAGVQNAVEAVVWDGGGLTGNPALTTAGATVVTPDAPGAGAAVSALENAFFQAHGYNGVIHVNTRAQGAVQYAGQVTTAGGAGRMVTPLGNAWSFGAGYDVTGPAGVAPEAGFVWAFITPQVYLWSTEVQTPEPTRTLDLLHNQWMGLAETVYMHAWVCDTVMAVQVPVAAPATTTAPAVPVPDVPGDVGELVTEEV